MKSKPHWGGKPLRGLAIAKAKARNDANSGAKIYDCPYRAKAWRSAWLSEFEKSQQQKLFD